VQRITLNGRGVIDIEIDGVDHGDYPDYCDAFICSAVWEDSLEYLTDGELDQLNDDSQLVYETVWDLLH